MMKNQSLFPHYLKMNVRVPDDEIVNPVQGTFIACSRFPREDTEIYQIIKILTLSDIIWNITDIDMGPCKAEILADRLVELFDWNDVYFDEDYMCTFAWVANDGRVIHQHST